ncbi:MAG TPA: FKBP-type peptidyl-prolyl cis-trans isomerase [Allosphingosinicella sp.]|nr:FKBP-type peptidyl-prolyl cis-trans isomerase [Allosphingosinicella sp.]
MTVTAVPIRPLKKGSVVKLWLGIALLALLAAALAWYGTRPLQVETTATGLRFQVLEEGTGDPVTPQDMAALHYQLSLEDGTVIQNSEDQGQPFSTGTEGLFPGFSEGLQRMREGGRYRMWVPPSLGLQGQIPPGAPFDADDTLVFKVRLLRIERGAAAMQRRMMEQMQQQGGAGAGPEAGGPPGREGAGGRGAGAPPPPPPEGNRQR